MIHSRGREYGVIHLAVSKVPEAATLGEYMQFKKFENIESLLSLGAVYLNEVRTQDFSAKINAEDYLRIHTQPRRFDRFENLKSRILKSTCDYMIVDKPAGLPVHAQVDNCRENLISFLEDELEEKLFVTHRLDIATSGCLLIARNLEAQKKINQLFRERLIKKHYVAQVESFVEPKTYIHFMKPSFSSPKILSNDATDGWTRCELKVLSCRANDKFFDCEIELITGRPQQIRAQLSFLGAPIIGDKKYGSEIELETNVIGLRCTQLTLTDLL